MGELLNFTVGPVMSSEDVLEIASHSAPYFRTPEFSGVMMENEAMMLDLLDAPEGSRCVFLTASGTGAMESCVMNVLSVDDNVQVVNGGTFGARFVQLCELHGLDTTEISLEFGVQLTEERLRMYAGKGYTSLLVNMSETSSGLLYDMELISRFCRDNNMLLIVDAVSAFLAENISMSELGAAAIITGSQKALAVQPGVSIVALSEEALVRVRANPEKCLYLSLKEALRNGERGQTPWTPAVTTLLQINHRLKGIVRSGGVQSEMQKIASRASCIRGVLSNLSIEMVPQRPANAVTAVYAPHHNAKEIFAIMKNEYGIWICPNGGSFANEVFRIGHIGSIEDSDNQRLAKALIDLRSRNIL